MLTTLALVAATALTNPTPECVFQRYITAAVWQAGEDARNHSAMPPVKSMLDVALSMQTAKERQVCGQ